MMKMKNNKKGVVGLELFTGIIVALFMVGLIVMVFQISGSKLYDSQLVAGSGTANNESLGNVTDGAYSSFDASAYEDAVCTITSVWNATNVSDTINSGNYTQSGCSLTATATSVYNATNWSINYTYVYNTSGGAGTVINDTMVATGEATDYFGLFIVLGAMVTIVLMLVLIIRAIKSSGITGDGA